MGEDIKTVTLKLLSSEHSKLSEKKGKKTWENFILSLAGMRERD